MAETLEQSTKAEQSRNRKAGSRWYHYLIGAAATAAFVGGAVCLHNKGIDEGYNKGKKESSAEEREAGIEEGKRIALKENPSFGWFEDDEIYASFTRSTNEGRATYIISLNGLNGTYETIIINAADGTAASYLDGDLEMEAYGGIRYSIGRYDGLVDLITFTDSEGYPRFLFRYRDYDGNKEEFEKADEILEQMKGFFSERH